MTAPAVIYRVDFTEDEFKMNILALAIIGDAAGGATPEQLAQFVEQAAQQIGDPIGAVATLLAKLNALQRPDEPPVSTDVIP